jgi:glutathione S-transferase
MPQTPGERAVARIWIDFANSKLVPAFYKLLLEQDLDKQEKWRKQFLDHLVFMETEGIGKLSATGQYWLGNCLSLVDLTFYPWLERLCVLQHYRDISLPENCHFLHKWWQEMCQRDSVQKIQNSPEFYIAEYEKYAHNTVNSLTAQEMRDQ